MGMYMEVNERIYILKIKYNKKNVIKYEINLVYYININRKIILGGKNHTSSWKY